MFSLRLKSFACVYASIAISISGVMPFVSAIATHSRGLQREETNTARISERLEKAEEFQREVEGEISHDDTDWSAQQPPEFEAIQFPAHFRKAHEKNPTDKSLKPIVYAHIFVYKERKNTDDPECVGEPHDVGSCIPHHEEDPVMNELYTCDAKGRLLIARCVDSECKKCGAPRLDDYGYGKADGLLENLPCNDQRLKAQCSVRPDRHVGDVFHRIPSHEHHKPEVSVEEMARKQGAGGDDKNDLSSMFGGLGDSSGRQGDLKGGEL